LCTTTAEVDFISHAVLEVANDSGKLLPVGNDVRRDIAHRLAAPAAVGGAGGPRAAAAAGVQRLRAIAGGGQHDARGIWQDTGTLGGAVG
jgi:hypothetical protein